MVAGGAVDMHEREVTGMVVEMIAIINDGNKGSVDMNIKANVEALTKNQSLSP